MRNWLYLPFLILMAVTYTRVVENIKSDNVYRGPASVEVDTQDECIDLPNQFNPHFISEQCL